MVGHHWSQVGMLQHRYSVGPDSQFVGLESLRNSCFDGML